VYQSEREQIEPEPLSMFKAQFADATKKWADKHSDNRRVENQISMEQYCLNTANQSARDTCQHVGCKRYGPKIRHGSKVLKEYFCYMCSMPNLSTIELQ
jgi:hypothetical protein